MKKENIYKILYVVSILLIIAFAIMLIVDYYNYNTYLMSAPFYTFIIARAAEFIVPGLIVLVIGKVIKKKYGR